MESLIIYNPKEGEWDSIQNLADELGMVCYGNCEKSPKYVYNIDGDIFTGDTKPSFGRKVSFDEFYSRMKGEDYTPPKPVCLCGSELIVVEYSGYYDSFNTWVCSDEECAILDDMKPIHTSKGSYV